MKASLLGFSTAALALQLACGGEIEDRTEGEGLTPAKGSGPGGGIGGRGGSAAVPPGSLPSIPPASACSTTKRYPGLAPLRRLMNHEYDNTVKDLLNDTIGPGKAFPVQGKGGGVFSNEVASVAIAAPLAVEGYITAAEQVAAAA